MTRQERPTVLVVEDEPAQREVLAYNLEAEGFRVARAENGEEALLLVDEGAPDVIVLDWMLPNVSGIEVCRRLKTRSDTQGVPIIMLSARSEEVDRVRGLETGADDYVIKPYSLVELMARIRAQLRRTRPAAVGQRLEYEDIVLDAETHRCSGATRRSSWGRRSSACSRPSWRSRAGYGRASSFSTGSGDGTSTSTLGRSMSISGGCARRCASTAAPTRCAPCAARATRSADRPSRPPVASAVRRGQQSTSHSRGLAGRSDGDPGRT